MKTQKTKLFLYFIATIAISMLLLGCGDGDDGINTLASNTNIAPGAVCAAGGVKLQAGKDVNENGVLDEAEVSSSAIICNGTNGSSGTTGPAGPAGPKGPAGEIIFGELV